MRLVGRDSGKSSPQGREKPAFERFYEENYFRLVRYLYGKIGNYQDAEDVAGDVFVYCYQNYDKFDPERGSINTWLYLIANSRLKNHYRDRRPGADFSQFEEWLFSEEPDMDRTVYLEQLRAFIAEQLDKLPERQRQAVVLRYFQEMSFEEIAERLDTTAGNVRTMLSRTLSKLEESLAGAKYDWRS